MGGITKINGIKVGHWTNSEAQTGCTAVLIDGGAIAGVDVRGIAPGTRETDLLRGYHTVDKIHAIMLSGGSAFGLDAACGAMQFLEERGIGIDVGVTKVPIVPSAIIFDLAVGKSDVRPGKAEGYFACENASAVAITKGRIGAGAGATVGKAFGMQYAMPGGIGSYAMELPGGIIIAALVIVNAFGDIYDHHNGQIIASANIDGRLAPCFEALGKTNISFAGSNTTLGIIATNAKLNREQANMLATIAHDGFALAIRPVHTTMDGDTIFSLSVGEVSFADITPILAVAPEVMACAIIDSVS